MQKSLFIGLLAVLVLVVGTSASAANESTSKAPKTRTLTRFCVRYEFNHVKWTHGDLNAYRGNRRVCIVGKPGKNGKAGKAGASGAQGFAGVVGAQGLPGARGLAGFDGKNGIDGLPGLNGINGVDGADGALGPMGPAGQPGATGAAGPQGEDGATGATGAAGPQGEAGPKGETGAVGPQGEAGATGATGAAGPQGGAGPKGETGATGPAGPAGPAGLNGSNIIAVDVSDASGQKTKVALCPLTDDPNDDPSNRLFAISGGFSAQGSVTESFRNTDGHGWTVTQSSGNTDSLHVYAYCA